MSHESYAHGVATVEEDELKEALLKGRLQTTVSYLSDHTMQSTLNLSWPSSIPMVSSLSNTSQ